jgi:hypothetical protein
MSVSVSVSEWANQWIDKSINELMNESEKTTELMKMRIKLPLSFLSYDLQPQWVDWRTRSQLLQLGLLLSSTNHSHESVHQLKHKACFFLWYLFVIDWILCSCERFRQRVCCLWQCTRWKDRELCSFVSLHHWMFFPTVVSIQW